MLWLPSGSGQDGQDVEGVHPRASGSKIDVVEVKPDRPDSDGYGEFYQ